MGLTLTSLVVWTVGWFRVSYEVWLFGAFFLSWIFFLVPPKK